MDEIKIYIKAQIAMYYENMGNFSCSDFVDGALDALTDVLEEIERIENKQNK